MLPFNAGLARSENGPLCLVSLYCWFTPCNTYFHKLLSQCSSRLAGQEFFVTFGVKTGLEIYEMKKKMAQIPPKQIILEDKDSRSRLWDTSVYVLLQVRFFSVNTLLLYTQYYVFILLAPL